MTLNLTRRSVKGTPLDAVDHDTNLDKLEDAIEATPAGAREWSADTITQAEAEAGTSTTRRAFTAQRVRQAVAAWWTGASTAAGRAMVEAIDAAAQRTLMGLGTADSPSFTGLTITGTAPVVIPHIHGTIAGNFYVHVRNDSGGLLTAGTAVYVVGSVGDTDRVRVAAADPTNPAKMPAIGLLDTGLANNGDGDAVVLGELRPFNTAAFALSSQLYVGAGGALVATPPATGTVQAVGSVARVSATTGTVLVQIGASMALAGFTGAYSDLSGKPTLGTAAATASTDYAPAAQGVTNGNSHDHSGGDGAQIAYSSLSGLPTLSTGDVVGPASSVDGRAALFDGSTGKLLKVSAAAPVLEGDSRLSDARTPTAHNQAASTITGLATVATTGAYADLSGKPTLGDWFILACSDEATALTTGTNKVRFRMPYAGTLTSLKASANTAPTGAALVVDVNENGTTVLSTKLSIDATELTSTTAAAPAVISDSALADDAEISIDIDQVGSTVAGAGLKVGLFIVRA